MKQLKSKWILGMLLIAIIVFLGACGSDDTTSGEEANNNLEEENSQGSESSESSEGYQGESFSWRIGFNTPEGSVRDVAAQKFKEVVESRTDGNVTIEVFAGEVLGTEQEMVEQVQVGALDFQLAGMGGMSNIIPEYSVLALPFMVNNFEEAYAVLDGPIGDELKAKAEESSFKVLAHTDLGFAQITNNVRPIQSPEDLSGVRMRSPNEVTSIKTFEQLGASVSTMPFTEVYLGLSQGVVDGQFNPLDAIYENNMHEVQDYLALTNHFYYHVNFIMSLDLWNSIDPELQTIIQEAANEARDASREFTQQMDQDMLDVLEGEFEEITTPDLDAFREAVQLSEFEDVIPAEFIQETVDFLEEYRGN